MKLVGGAADTVREEQHIALQPADRSWWVFKPGTWAVTHSDGLFSQHLASLARVGMVGEESRGFKLQGL